MRTRRKRHSAPWIERLRKANQDMHRRIKPPPMLDVLQLLQQIHPKHRHHHCVGLHMKRNEQRYQCSCGVMLILTKEQLSEARTKKFTQKSQSHETNPVFSRV